MDFKEMARINRVRNIDKLISITLSETIKKEINEEQEIEVKGSLENRKKQIEEILENYEECEEIITQRDRYNKKYKKNQNKNEVDSKLQDIVIEEMNKIYNKCSENYIKVQILDRGIFLRNMLEDFDEEFKYIQDKIKNKKSTIVRKEKDDDEER